MYWVGDIHTHKGEPKVLAHYSVDRVGVDRGHSGRDHGLDVYIYPSIPKTNSWRLL